MCMHRHQACYTDYVDTQSYLLCNPPETDSQDMNVNHPGLGFAPIATFMC